MVRLIFLTANSPRTSQRAPASVFSRYMAREVLSRPVGSGASRPTTANLVTFSSESWTFLSITARPYRSAASASAIAAISGNSWASRAAWLVEPVVLSSASGNRRLRYPRHWARAWGWERITFTSPGLPRPRRQCLTCRFISPTIWTSRPRRESRV